MQVEYKRKKVTVWQPCCPKCKEELQGNNSIVQPYQCSCGIWQYDWYKQEFYIIPVNLKQI